MIKQNYRSSTAIKMVFETHSAVLLLAIIFIIIQTVFHCQAFESGSGDIGSGIGSGIGLERGSGNGNLTISEGPHICNDSSVRLVNGTAPYNGRLEVCNNDTWGTVCNASFSLNDGDTVCLQLGFFGAIRLTDEFGPGTGDIIWLSDLDCRQGTERSLLECTRAEFFCGPNNCQPCHHYRDVGIICRPHKDPCNNGAVRLDVLLKKRWPLYGQVELCVDGLWAFVNADYQHGNYIGRVVCRQLGYKHQSSLYSIVPPALYALRGRLDYDIDIICKGSVTNLSDCDVQMGLSTSAQFPLPRVMTSCYDLQLITNSTTVQLGPDRIEETVNLTCIASINEIVYWERITDWFFEKELLGSDFDTGRYRISRMQSPSNMSITLQIINPRKSDEGTYSCLFAYRWAYFVVQTAAVDHINQTHDLELKAELSAINVSEVNRRTLSCELAGYLSVGNDSAAVDIAWFRENEPLQPTNGLYNVTISNNSQNWIITGEGIKVPSIISTLYIYTTDVAGNYSCIVLDGNSTLYQNLTLINDVQSSTTYTTTGITTSSMKSSSTSPSTIIHTTTTTSSTSKTTAAKVTVATTSNFTLSTSAADTPATDGLGAAVTAWIAVGTTIFIILICCLSIIIICVIIERKLKSKVEPPENISFAINQQLEMTEKNLYRINSSIQREKLNELHLSSCVIDKSDLKVMEKIGQGEFGVVYRGVYSTNELSLMSVAIKTVKGLYSESRLADELLVEADKMKSFDHLHVLSLIGICVGLLESPCIVMPFMSNGSLLSYMRREANDLIINEIADENVHNSVLKHLLSICLQVAKGMDYLTQKKFIHRDLAARNCMISSEGIIKIADFGLAEDVYTTVYFKRPDQGPDQSVKLPLKWMALESIHLGKYDEKTDVWSYGVLCWEIFNGGKTPYPGNTPKEVVTMLDNGERLSKPTNAACTEEVYSIMMSCWENSPTCRPHFFELVKSINGLLVPLADYMDLSSDYIKFNCE